MDFLNLNRIIVYLVYSLRFQNSRGSIKSCIAQCLSLIHIFGKSTFLSRVTNANPKIANYHFTTLAPNLGVVDLADGEGFVLADIPGLIEGASLGAGLGHEFLRHIERTKMMIHVVDAAGSEGRDPVSYTHLDSSRPG